LDEKYGLLRTFKDIASARAQYFSLNMKDISESYQYFFERPDCMSKRFSDDFVIPDDDMTYLFNKEMGELSSEEWEEIFEYIPDELLFSYQLEKQEIEDWRRHFSQETTLCTGKNEAILCDDIGIFPRWFIGYIGDHNDDLLLDSSDWLAKIISNQCAGDPMSSGQQVDWAWNCIYLVLYPDSGLNRIIPYLFMYTEEGSNFFPLNADIEPMTTSYSIYKPWEEGKKMIGRSLSIRLKESLTEIYESWDSTANILKTHPYLQWQKDQDNLIDDHIKALFDRTGHIKNKKK